MLSAFTASQIIDLFLLIDIFARNHVVHKLITNSNANGVSPN
jgi:hypothetical protein